MVYAKLPRIFKNPRTVTRIKNFPIFPLSYPIPNLTTPAFERNVDCQRRDISIAVFHLSA